MKRRSLYFCLPLSLLLVASVGHGQDFDRAMPKKPRLWSDYAPRTLKQIARQGAHAERRSNKQETMLIQADLLPSRVRVTYQEATRPLTPLKREVLRQWAQRYAGFPESYTKPYLTEVQFTEDGTEYWLAVRKEILPRLQQALQKGEIVDLHLIRVGEARESKLWELVMLVENFQKPTELK